ncbi:protein-tyrosine-phosphatase [Maribacter sp.]|uniref:protein-tyrosine-phosphatase n=1 Tax=Maribacter sp. TaxID=1897614 RepID=UPI0025C4B9B1|nr:protein-tyrosine-phosphatase [Maribacter sp.]
MLYPEITKQIEILDITTISEERKTTLEPLQAYIQNKKNQNKDIRLHFICTHNSRRSHLSQVWAQTLAAYFNIANIFCYSGGTEVTALFPMAAKALTISGFHIKTISNENNPVYSIKNSENNHPILGFSKTYDDTFNPTSEFAAILTCSNADKGCPFITGAEQRIPITFEDPKAFDNTPQQEEKYVERSIQIATELLFVFSNIK